MRVMGHVLPISWFFFIYYYAINMRNEGKTKEV